MTGHPHLNAHLASLWDGPCKCAGCERRFEDSDDITLHGNDAYCDRCSPIYCETEEVEEMELMLEAAE